MTVAKLILICGPVCAGKSTYARRLAAETGAVALSSDDLTKPLSDLPGVDHDAIFPIVHDYLLRVAADLVRHGLDVILDWGFWRRDERAALSARLRSEGVPFEWRGLRVDPAQLRCNILRRNANPGPTDYIVDEGLLNKCLALFEVPEPEEMDEWVALSDERPDEDNL